MWLRGTLMMLSWIAIIAAAVLVSRSMPRRPRPPRAREIRQERYASGELSTEDV